VQEGIGLGEVPDLATSPGSEVQPAGAMPRRHSYPLPCFPLVDA